MAIKKINTDLQIEAGLLDNDGNSGSANQVLVSTSTGVDWVDGSGSGIIGGPYLPLVGGTMTGNLNINTSTNFPLLFTGTNSNYTAIGIKNTGTGDAGIYMDSINGDFGGSDYAFIGQKDEGYLLYNIGINSPLPYHVFTGGNVGIGTTSPGTKLHVGSGSGAIVDTGYQMVIDSGGIAGLQILSATTQSGRIVFGDSGDNDIGMIKYDHTDNSMGFRTNGSGNERMRISNTGNVGIGTTAPTSILQIAKPSNVAYDGTNDSGQETIGASVTITNTNTTVDSFAQINMQVSASSNRAVGRIVTIAKGSASSDMAFVTEKFGVRAEKMRIKDDGNVGIGTTSPGGALDVVGAYLATLFRVSNTEADATTKYGSFMGRHYTNSEENITGMLLTSSSNALTGGTISIGGGITAANAVNEIKFYTAANNTTLLGSERMRITNSGNVGIGTTNPGEKLDLAGTNVGVKINGTQSSRVYYNRSGTYTWSTGLRSGDTKFHIFDERSGDRVVIDDTGNVGIGTTAPAAKLHVSGTSFFFDQAIFDDKVGIGTTSPSSKLQVAGGIQMADDSATAAATKVGTMRYRTATDEPVPVTGIDFITNGDFATDSDWTKSTNATISGGQVTLTANGAAQYIIQGSLWPANTLSGQKVLLTYTIVSNSLNAGDFRIGGYTGASAFTLTGLPTTVGTHSVTLDVRTSAGDDNAIDLYVTSAATSGALVIDNVSLIEVTSEDASYADMCMQTGSSTYEWVNIVRNTY